MTDKDIIKGLKHLRTSTLNGWREKKITEKDLNTISYALDLINRQKEEIEMLKQNLEEAHIDIRGLLVEIEMLNGFVTSPVQLVNEYDIMIAKSEAIKDFAENLKNKIANLEANSPNKTYQMAMQDMLDYYVPKIVDDCVKEMTEEAN